VRPYTKWYNIGERVELADFYSEMFIVPFIVVVIFIHIWGTRANRSKAKAWSDAHAPVLSKEFAQVGTGGAGKSSATVSHPSRMRVSTASQYSLCLNDKGILTEKGANEFVTYATGRENIACVDIKLSLLKRYNPMALIAEQVLGFVFESMPAPSERMEATLLTFDGAESGMVPAAAGGAMSDKPSSSRSSYDGFVFAVVHKNYMKTLRDGRYDLSLTSTKDHAKLPQWATTMSESAEITDAMLTPELLDALRNAENSFEALVISDQPIDAPKT